MTYDCFCFSNELDLLELRLNELSSVVDYFVLVESECNHQKRSKALFYKDNKERFSHFNDRIIHIVISASELPLHKSSWDIEHFQRNQIMRGLDNCKPQDLILISDLDEIPRPDAITRYRNTKHPIRLYQDLFYYFLNFRCIERRVWTLGTRMLPFRALKSPQEARKLSCHHLDNAGWHFSYLGGPNAIIQKINAFAHAEFNVEKYNNASFIQHQIRAGTDVFGRNLHFEKINIDKTFPVYLQSNQAKYSRHLI